LALALLGAVPAFARSGSGNHTPAAKKNKEAGTTAATPESPAKHAEAIKPTGSAVAAELAQLQQMIQAQSKQIAAQQQQIEALQHQIRGEAVAPGPAPQPAVAPTGPAPGAGDAVVPVAMTPSRQPATIVPAKVTVESPSSASSGTAQLPQKKPEAIELAGGKIKLGFTLYGDWGMYFKTGFGPQFFTQINQPGPGNDYFNSFDINRTYINFFYSPNSAITMRITPNLYRQLGSAGAVRFGKYGAVDSSVNGNLALRIKYAYIDFNHPFASSEAFGKDKITIGQQTNPLIDWEEALYGYRFTSLVPWNYLSLSSTHAGVKVHGPIGINGKNLFDYEVGVFDSGSFHNQEQAAEKQVMARLSYYPLGAHGRLDGFGLTGFVDYGYANAAPDLPSHDLYRVATLVHYTNSRFGLAGEFDYGKNAFGVGNLFSGSGPAEAFGLAEPAPAPYAGLVTVARSVLGLGAQQRGFDFFGHVNIPHSPLSIFGLYQYFQPNINIGKDPLDFSRLVAGIAYRYNSHLQFALDSQNLIYTHSQFAYNGIPNAVPTNTNALFINVELDY
jgi:hypothetical protein